MNELAKKIASEIGARGEISFARFMELALYCPDYGYYEREKDNIGKSGDYFTNVSVGRLFGELLAFQFAEWQSKVQGPKAKVRPGRNWVLVEAGAHDGKLAKDILLWLWQNRPELFEVLHYWIVEPSPRRRVWQQQCLSEFQPIVRWVDGLGQLQRLHPKGIRGVIFSNELLDALPVRRFGWDAETRIWFEWGVALQQGGFVWTRLPEDQISPDNRPLLPGELEEFLPDGFTIELCPAAEDWWRQAAGLLASGQLLTIDYGLTDADLLIPERPHGTLRAYHNQRLSDDPLARPGEQDLTAHVNFSALQRAGEALGLQTKALVRQEKFLTKIASEAWKAGGEFAGWGPQRKRQFQTLTSPQHLGRAFQVLVQSRE